MSQIAGHPGSDAESAAADSRPTPDSAPTSARINIGGTAFDVPADVADAFRREVNRRDGEHGARLQQLQERLARLEEDRTEDSRPAQESAQLQPPDDRLALEDPVEHARKQREYNEALVHRTALALEQRRYEEAQQRQQESQRESAWNSAVQQFYRGHPELKGAEDVVDAVWRNNYNTLKDLPVKDGFEELARLSADRLVGLTEHGKKVASKRVTLEAGSTTRPKAQPKPEEQQAGSMSAFIRERQRARNSGLRMPATSG